MPRHPAEPQASDVESPVLPVNAQPVLTIESLLGVIASMQKQQADANDKLANALLESRKPYEDPNKKVNDDLFRKQFEETARRQEQNQKYSQSVCEHIAGCNPLGDTKDLYGRTSIVWHIGDVGQDVGICTVCQRIWHEGDPDFSQWRTKKSINVQSASGRRTVYNPIEARELARL